MIDDHPNASSFDEDPSSEKSTIKEAIMRKLLALTQEEDPQIRKQLTHELTVEISEMMRENQEMKQELIAFIRRLRG